MIPFPEIDPVIFRVGPLAVRWYGLMYLFGFAGSFFYMRYLARLRNFALSTEEVSDLIFYGIFGVVLGGRVGYTLFYNFGYYSEHPLEILAVWQGGMSFHGGLLGVIVAILLFCKRRQKSILQVGDIVAAATPIGTPSASGCDSLGAPKRREPPAASRMPTIDISRARLCAHTDGCRAYPDCQRWIRTRQSQLFAQRSWRWGRGIHVDVDGFAVDVEPGHVRTSMVDAVCHGARRPCRMCAAPVARSSVELWRYSTGEDLRIHIARVQATGGACRGPAGPGSRHVRAGSTTPFW